MVAGSDGTGSRPTRVLVRLNSLGLGGCQINAVDLAAAVRAHGYESVLFGPAESLPDGPSLVELMDQHGLTWGTFPAPHSTGEAAAALARLARSYEVDLVHTYSSHQSRPAFWGPSLFGRRPLVATVYEMAIEEGELEGTTLVVGSRDLRDEHADRRGPVRLISPPVDLARDAPEVDAAPFLAAHALPATHLRVVIVSRLDGPPTFPVKSTGIEQAIRAVEALGRADVDLLIVGGGNAERELRAAGDAVNSRLGRRAVVFTGPTSDPRAAYASADVVIGMGGSAARGLAFGKPLVVVGEHGWFRTFTPATADDLFRTSFWSIDVVPDPVGQLVDELSPLLADHARRAALGRFGREFAQANFGLAAMAEELARTYEVARADYGLRPWAHDLRNEARMLGRKALGKLRRARGSAPIGTTSAPVGSAT